MWKKMLASLFIGASILAIGSLSHATGGETSIIKVDNKVEIKAESKTETKAETKAETETKAEQSIDLSKYQITRPEKTEYELYDKVEFIHGKAPADTSIVISVYGTTDLTRKNFDLRKLPSEDDYIEVFSETITSGNLGIFKMELNLVTGINKIVISFQVEGVPPIELIVHVKAHEAINNSKEIKLPEKLTDIIIQK